MGLPLKTWPGEHLVHTAAVFESLNCMQLGSVVVLALQLAPSSQYPSMKFGKVPAKQRLQVAPFVLVLNVTQPVMLDHDIAVPLAAYSFAVGSQRVQPPPDFM